MSSEWLKLSISPLKDLIGFLHQQSKTNDVIKKKLFMELRDNLNVFSNAFLNQSSSDHLIDLLSNDAIRKAVDENFKFSKLRSGSLLPSHIKDDRNKKYIGWTAEKLIDKIDEKIAELKNIKKLNGGSVEKVKNNIPAMLSNLYYRMKLLAEWMRSENRR